MKTARLLLLLACLGACALAPGAIAGSPKTAGNFGFENECAGFTCNWGVIGFGGTATRDLINPHSGSVSLAYTKAAPFTSAVQSACIAVKPGTPYSTGFWYRTTDPNTTAVTYEALYWSDSTCSGTTVPGGDGGAGANPPTADGQWHEATATPTTAPAGAGGVTIRFSVTCVPCYTDATATASVNLDDVTFAPIRGKRP